MEFWDKPTVLLIFSNTDFKCSSKLYFESNIIPKYLSRVVRLTMLLLNIKPGWFFFEVLRLDMISYLGNFIFFMEILKSKQKKLTLTSFYYVSSAVWSDNWRKLIWIDQSRFDNFSYLREFKICWTYVELQNILAFFNNAPPASLVRAYNKRFFICYSSFYHSSMLTQKV